MTTRHAIAILVLGILLGAAGKDLVDSTLPKMQAKLPVGTCFSNGLYFEKIIEIRTSKVLKRKEYVTIGFVRGKKIAPDTTASWVIDDDAVVVDGRYCDDQKK